MGLTINYSLRLRTKSGEKIKALLERLRQKALDLPFEMVDESVTHLTPEICAQGLEYYRGPRGLDHQPESKQHLFHLLWSCSAGVMLPWAKKRETSVTVEPFEAYIFETCPGPGSEWARFGLARYPAEVEADYTPESDDKFNTVRAEKGLTRTEFDLKKWERHVNREHERQPAEGNQGPSLHEFRVKSKRMARTRLADGWQFSQFCKTQYASDPSCGGLGNFLRCHLSVIRMLEYARELGFEVEIDDEGHFGPANYSDDHEEARAAGREPTYVDHPATHSIKTLVEKIGNYNRLVAGMSGLMRDVAGARGQKMESPIFHFPNFEHLEADFHIKDGAQFDAAIKAFAEIAKKEAATAEAKAKESE